MDRDQERLVEKLFRSEYERLRAIATALVHDPSLAEDSVQKAFCIALEKEEELNNHPNPHGWITQVVRYTALDEMKMRDRRRKRFVSLDWDIADELEADGGEMKDTPNSTEILAKIRKELKPNDYSLLMRTIEKDSRGEEIAAEFGLTVNTYYKRMERIRKRVKDILYPGKITKIFFLIICQILTLLSIYR